MKITPVSLFLAVFAVFMIIVILSGIKRETINLRSALLWIGLMIGIGFFSLFPDALNGILRFTRMKDRMMFMMLSFVFVLLAFIFNLSAKYDRMQRNWAKIVQELALITSRMEKQNKENKDRPGA